MIRRSVQGFGQLLALVPLVPLAVWAQESGPRDERTIPIPPSIARAIAAGTRDSAGHPGPRYWQIMPRYRIDARLDPATARLTGRETVLLRNTSPAPLQYIVLRLDQNRFRRGTPGDTVPPATDGMTVTRLAVDGRVAQIGGAGEASRPSLSGTRTTSETIALARPLLPQDSVRLEIDWHYEVPRDDSSSALRQGRWGNAVFQIAQWYPRIAMYDDLNGWDTTSYGGEVEFYNPFARFDVNIDVPAGWLVGATGVLVNPADVLSARTLQRLEEALQTDSTTTIAAERERGVTRTGDRLTWRFRADSVRDFAWGTSDTYMWRAARATIPGRDAIIVHMLFTRRRAAAYDSVAKIVRRDLAFNSTLMGPYPYPQHTLLDGPEGGMEYPMLTMSDGTRLDHELWHQWFPMVVGTNETWYSFLDEGFAAYLTGVRRAHAIGAGERASRSGSRGAPLIWPDDREPPGPLAAVSGYGRPVEMFSALEEVVGRQVLLNAIRTYATEWRFKHPSPWDFMFTMNRALGQNLDDFWFQWLFTVNEPRPASPPGVEIRDQPSNER